MIKIHFRICTILFFLFLFSLVKADCQIQKVRVAFFPMGNYHIYDKNGNITGYDIDYLKKISSYTDWQYTYVKTNSFEKALALLETNELDIIGPAPMTSQLKQRFNYTSSPLGTAYGILTTLKKSPLIYEDFKQFNKIKIGIISNSFYFNSFLNYAKNHQFTPHFIYYANSKDMRNDLHSGTIDAMINTVLDIRQGEKILAEFNPNPFYYLVNKNNAQLLQDLNQALVSIKLNAPNFANNLFTNYYPITQSKPYTKEELDFIKSCPPIKIANMPNRKPLSWLDKNNDLHGISINILKHIAKESGLRFTYVILPDGEAPHHFLKSGKADLVAGVLYSGSNLTNSEFRLTNPYLKSNLVMVQKKGQPFSPALRLKIAIPQNFVMAIEHIKENYPNFEIKEYVGVPACLEAVVSGRADLMIQNIYIIEEYLYKPRYQSLTIIPQAGTDELFSIMGAVKTTDPQLISILNKAISHIPKETLDQYIINNTASKKYDITLTDFVDKYQEVLILGFIFIIVIIICLLYALKQKKNNFKLIKQNEQTLTNITNNINGGIITLSKTNEVLINYANDGLLDFLGYTRQEYEENNGILKMTNIQPQDGNNILNLLHKNWDKGEKISLELSLNRKDGSFVPSLLNGTISKNESGKVTLFCVIVDISQHKRLIEEMAAEKEKYQITIEYSDDIIFDLDYINNKSTFSSKFYKKFGWFPNKWCSKKDLLTSQKIHSDDFNVIKKIEKEIFLTHKSNIVFRLRLLKSNNLYLWCEINLACLYKSNKLIRIIGKITDIDSQIKEHDELKKLSQHDSLTNLYVKKVFEAKVKAILQSKETDNSCAMLFIDLDNFKSVNDTLGHLIGDQCLLDTANKLKTVFSSSNELVSRFGGDEFCIFINNTTLKAVEEKVQQALDLITCSYTAQNDSTKKTIITASIGIAYSSNKQIEFAHLLEFADRALYMVKENGKYHYNIHEI